MKKVLGNKLYLSMFFSDMLSNFGDVLYYLALMTYVSQLHSAKLGLSMISISETLPIVFSLFIGIYADRNQKKVETIFKTLLLRVILFLIMGILMGFTPALWIVFVAAVINFTSILAGQYENALYTPISLRVVANEDREETMGFRQSVSSVLTIVFQSSGAILITMMTFQQLAFVNMVTFLISFLIIFTLRPRINTLLEKNPIKQEEQSSEKKGLLKQAKSDVLLMLHEIKMIPVLRMSMIIVPVLNALLGVIDTLIVLYMTQNKSMVLGSVATTLATISVIFLVGNILGGILAMSVLKKVSPVFMIRIAAFFPFLVFLTLLSQQIYLFLGVVIVVSLIAGAINPKVGALIMNSLPEEKIATISMGLNVYFTIGNVFSQLLVSGLIVIFSAQIISFILMVASTLLIFYTFYSYLKTK